MARRAYERTGLIPRSIIRTFDRFRKQLFTGGETAVIHSFRVSRYQIIVSVKCLVSLIFIPLVVHFIAKTYFLRPLIEYLWNTQQTEIFLNVYQENRAFSELHDFEEKLFFESLLKTDEKSQINGLQNERLYKTRVQKNKKVSYQSLLTPRRLKSEFKNDVNKSQDLQTIRSPEWLMFHSPKDCFPKTKNNQQRVINPDFANSESLRINRCKSDGIESKSVFFDAFKTGSLKQPKLTPSLSYNVDFIESGPCENRLKSKAALENSLSQRFQQKTIELHIYYNQQSIQNIINFFGDVILFFTISLLFSCMEPQIIILKSFLIESIYSFSDTTKSFLLILLTNLLVGFHSPRGWEIVIEIILQHLGLPENQDFIFILVASLPVLLDTLFKYWIFRYLNRISPSTVVTYHNMLE